ncbi:MAG: trypsin-like peptidase domain-containing protein [Pirellulaceae bacterium]
MVSLQVCLLAAALAGNSDTTLLSFTADWCGPCRLMQPTIQRLHDAGYPIREVNIDRNPDLASQFTVRPIPCFILVRDGREVDRVVGEVSYDRLVQMFEQPARAVSPAIPLAAPRDANQRSQSPDDGSAPRVPLPPLETRSRDLAGPPPPPATVAPSQQVATPAGNSAQQIALQATVRLRVVDATGVSHGTGTIIDVHGDDALVLTCGHIFRDSQGQGEIYVELFVPGATQPVRGQLLTYEAPETTSSASSAPAQSQAGNAGRRDVGLVSIRPGVAVRPVRVASPDYRPQRGEPVFSVGCDHGADPTVRETTISTIDRYLGPPSIEIFGHPVEGRSGGGLFTADGRVIGVCNAADTQEDRGIYAGPGTIHFELKSINQERIYLAAAPAPPLSGIPGPALEPPPPRNPARGVPSSIQPVSAVQPATASDAMEVICILRSPGENGSGGEVLVVNSPSTALLRLLQQESRGGATDVARRPSAPAVLSAGQQRQPPTPPAVVRAQNE